MRRTILTPILLCFFGSFLIAGEDYQLFKQGKNHWYKDNWDEAAESFETLVTRYPDGPFFIKGLYFLGYCRYKLDEKDESFKHLTDLIAKANTKTNSNVIEDAKSLRLRIAYEFAEEDPGWKGVLVEGLNDPTLGIRMQAASWLAKLGDPAGIGVLFEVVEKETDRDLTDRAVRNILLVGSDADKKRLDTLLEEKNDNDQGKVPKMLRLVIRNLNSNQETIKINLPVSLFPVLLKSLTPEQRDLIEGTGGVDLNAIARSLKSIPANTILFEVKGKDEEIKLFLD